MQVDLSYAKKYTIRKEDTNTHRVLDPLQPIQIESVISWVCSTNFP